MRFTSRASLLFSTLILLANSVEAQVDPSSALLLNSSGDTTVRESGIGSGRYTVRPKADGRRDTTRNVRSETAEPTSTPAPTAPSPVAAAAEAATPSKPRQPQKPAQAPQAIVASTPIPQPPAPAPVSQQSVSDTRPESSTLMEISIAPGYLYNSSESGYSYRNYNASAPTIAADARVWISSSIAVQAGYLGTLSASVSDSRDGSRSVAAAQQWFTAGVRSRSFLGASRLAPSLSASFDYYEYEFRAPSDALTRAKLKSTGIRVSVDADIPVTPYRSWTVGVSLAPKLQHREASTKIDFQSGGNVDANLVGVSIGSNIRFNAESSMFIKLTHAVEKDLFAGPASDADPVTGVKPSGVSVTNSFTLFQLGYTWGN